MPDPLPATALRAIESRAQFSVTQRLYLGRDRRSLLEGHNRVLARDVDPGLADFVLHAHEDVLRLVAEVRRLRDLLQDRA